MRAGSTSRSCPASCRFRISIRRRNSRREPGPASPTGSPAPSSGPRTRSGAGASVPDGLAARFDGLEHDVETRKLIAAAVAAEQVLDLVDRGVTEFHFYTMNRADLVYAICPLLGLRAQTPAAVEKAAA